jgi:hypothetical protein
MEPATMTRQTWTDDRMDDLARRMDAGFAQVDARFAQVHADIRALQADVKEVAKEAATRQELKAAVAELRSEMNNQFLALNRRFDMLVTSLLAAALTGVVALIAPHVF